MPLYDYRCKSCQHTTEVRHGFGETFAGPCPSCGGEVARVFNPAGIVFKGSGFYINDSRASSAPSKSGGVSANGAPDTVKADTPASDKPSDGGSTPAAAAPASTPTGDSGPKKSDTAA